MKTVKTYEGFFDFLKRKKKTDILRQQFMLNDPRANPGEQPVLFDRDSFVMKAEELLPSIKDCFQELEDRNVNVTETIITNANEISVYIKPIKDKPLSGGQLCEVLSFAVPYLKNELGVELIKIIIPDWRKLIYMKTPTSTDPRFDSKYYNQFKSINGFYVSDNYNEKEIKQYLSITEAILYFKIS